MSCQTDDLTGVDFQHTMWELLGRVETDRRHAENDVDSNVRLHCVRIILSLSLV